MKVLRAVEVEVARVEVNDECEVSLVLPRREVSLTGDEATAVAHGLLGAAAEARAIAAEFEEAKGGRPLDEVYASQLGSDIDMRRADG
jgi:hypothetical protein